MEDGQFKIIAIIQARLGSTRLPNKVLMPLPIGSNSTIISQVIEGLSTVKSIAKIVVATSKKTINDDLEKAISKDNISCFRGEEEDVLSRFYHIVKENKYDIVIRLTADNPIVDQVYLEEFIHNFRTKNLDYSYSKNLPVGCNFEIMKASEIIKAYENTDSIFDKEHVTPYIRRNAKNIEYFQFKSYKSAFDLRLTIDYPTDYAFMQVVFSKLGNKAKNLENINTLISENPWIIEINKENFQKKEWSSLNEEIDHILPILKERELSRIQKILENVQ